MWPWGHLAVAYLLYHGARRLRNRPVTGIPVLVLALGSQLPDLIDKPLAWYLAVLPSGRSAAHSLLALGLLSVAVLLLRRRTRSPVPAALLLGYGSHVALDALDLVASPAATLRDGRFLLYPLLPVADVGAPLHPLTPDLSVPYVAAQPLLLLAAVALWLRSGAPGLRELKGWVTRRRA